MKTKVEEFLCWRRHNDEGECWPSAIPNSRSSPKAKFINYLSLFSLCHIVVHDCGKMIFQNHSKPNDEIVLIKLYAQGLNCSRRWLNQFLKKALKAFALLVLLLPLMNYIVIYDIRNQSDKIDWDLFPSSESITQIHTNLGALIDARSMTWFRIRWKLRRSMTN